jgi:fructoselysine 6-kinase
MKIITIGDNVVDCYLDQMKYYPGGNCINVAVNAKRLGANDVEYIGIFGTDEKAEHIQYALREEGVGYTLSRTALGISGQPGVNLTKKGDRVFAGSVKHTIQHILKLRLTDEDYALAAKYDVCHTSCYSSIETELSKLSQAGPISFDFSDRRDPDYFAQVCPHIDYAFFSGSDLKEDEIEGLIKTLEPYSLNVIGITCGVKPAVFINHGKRYEKVPLSTVVVDTMGAGDSFIAGFLIAFLDGADMEMALHAAADSARRTCQFYGGFGYPKDITS